MPDKLAHGAMHPRSHYSRGAIERVNDRADLLCAKLVEAVALAGERRLGCVAFAPLVAPNMVADLKQLMALNLLGHDSTVAKQQAVRLALNHPQSVAALGIAAHGPGYPARGALTSERLRVEAHHLRVGKDRIERVKIGQS